jgi:hypothetical protein
VFYSAIRTNVSGVVDKPHQNIYVVKIGFQGNT